MLVDAEHAFDPAYSKALGVDVENLIVCQPDNGEMALESKIFACFWMQYCVVHHIVDGDGKIFTVTFSCRSYV